MNVTKPARTFGTMLTILSLAAASAMASTKPMPPRKVVSLDGTWQVEQGSMDRVPQSFSHTVIVPGLLDLAQPAFQEVGKKSPQREAFWYRRTFKVDGPVPPVAILKIHKARYGTKVLLNGGLVGEHLPCFTPAYLDVRKHLKGGGQENELVIRVGANRESIPQDMPTGWDFEKYLYIPGIYDSVELILTGTVHIVRVQTVPDLPGSSVRVLVTLRTDRRAAMFPLDLTIREAPSGRQVAKETANPGMYNNEEKTFDFKIAIKDCRLWSPEDPFLS
jgi:beta-galactosidase